MGNKIGKGQFNKLSLEDKKKVAQNPNNRQSLNSIRAMCDPHSRMSDYEGDAERLLSLVNAHFTMCPRQKLEM